MNKTQEELFDDWWARNHPFDWWAKEREGEPLTHGDRLRVWDLCRRAYLAGNEREVKGGDRESSPRQ